MGADYRSIGYPVGRGEENRQTCNHNKSMKNFRHILINKLLSHNVQI